MISKKICLVGDYGVGKTSLIRRFVDRQFSDRYLSTVGVKISRKLVESVNLQLLIWDIEGHTKFKGIAPSYLQGASGAVVVGDLSRLETIERLSEHVQLFLSINPKGSLVIALNKSDLIDTEERDRLTQQVQLQEWERVVGIYQTSAKTGSHVDEMFQQLACQMIASI